MSDPESLLRNAHVDGDEAPERAEHFFDGWLTIAPGSALLGFAEFFAIVLGNEVQRQRQRRDVDQRAFDAAIRSVVANLSYPLIVGSARPAVAVSLAKPSGRAKTSYPLPAGAGYLPTLIGQLAERELLTLHVSRKKGIASSIQASRALTRFVADRKLTMADLKRKTGRQTIILRSSNKDFWAEARTYREFDYAETADTLRWREELRRINERLSHTPMVMVDRPAGLDLSKRELLRAFVTDESGTERWDRGGRLWRGWWQNVPKELRPRIFIDTQRVADIDFTTMYLRLAYLKAGLVPPDGDLYAGIVPDDAGGLYRATIKQFANALLFFDKPLQRRPKGITEPLPEGWSAGMIREAILQRHAPIAHVFETGIGLYLMRTESDILVDALLAMDREGFAALPMHDGLMTARRNAQRAKAIMEDAAGRQTGFRLPTKCTLL